MSCIERCRKSGASLPLRRARVDLSWCQINRLEQGFLHAFLTFVTLPWLHQPRKSNASPQPRTCFGFARTLLLQVSLASLHCTSRLLFTLVHFARRACGWDYGGADLANLDPSKRGFSEHKHSRPGLAANVASMGCCVGMRLEMSFAASSLS